MNKSEHHHALRDRSSVIVTGVRDSVPDKLRAAAREIVEKPDAPAVAMRDVARRVGVSAPAVYRYFASRDDLLASVAAEGFDELTVELDAAARAPDPLVSLGLAYLDFATTKRGMFSLMFGPLLADRRKYPALNDAAATAFDAMERTLAAVDDDPADQSPATATARGLVRGLSNIVVKADGRNVSADWDAHGPASATKRSKPWPGKLN